MSTVGQSILRGAREALAYAETGDSSGIAAVTEVAVPDEINIKAMRKNLGMTQQDFASSFGLDLSALRAWEQGRRKPDRSARLYLMVVSHNPNAVRSALAE